MDNNLKRSLQMTVVNPVLILVGSFFGLGAVIEGGINLIQMIRRRQYGDERIELPAETALVEAEGEVIKFPEPHAIGEPITGYY
jgi:hypothetical protein